MSVLPPYAQLLKLRTTPDPRGGADLFVMPAHEGVVGRPGFLHGGAIAGFCEYAAFESLRHALGEATTRMKPVTITIDYMRGGQLLESFARAEIIRLGRRIANLEVRAWQDDETRPIALARINFLLDRAAS